MRSARDHGVKLWADGERLRYRSVSPLDADFATLLGTWRAEILAFLVDSTLEGLCAEASPEDALALREERAGILEFQAQFTREKAEGRARI